MKRWKWIWQQAVVPDEVVYHRFTSAHRAKTGGQCLKVMSVVCELGRLVQYITTMVHKKKNKAKKIALCSIIIAVLCEEEVVVTRREWCKDWLQKRNERGLRFC
ncbi:hypothetical protein E2C01_021745 [Portunus trituberculatus]|uniref:Uncharacterized protein n=1 Tax=Portunus trituberculatus TaxID=210409 RepID=A0A5B7E5R3_PORTR|nr:hypothetical protein [Portunus trituberculatus]